MEHLGYRHHSVISNLVNRNGICLDVGSAEVKSDWRNTIENKGYKYFSLDIRKVRKSTNAIQGDICKLPIKSNFVYLIICSDVLEHIISWETALNELYRILKEKGLLYLHVPIYFGLDKNKRIEPDKWEHVWLFTDSDVIAQIKKTGFEIARVLYKYDTGDILVIGTKL